MTPTRLLTRPDLIQYVADTCGDRACRRACFDPKGMVQVLGGFSQCPPAPYPGWMVEVTSRHGRKWLWAVLAKDSPIAYQTVYRTEVPWALWAGRVGRGMWNMYDGDFPDTWADITAAERARAEPGRIPWEEVKRGEATNQGS